MSIGLVLGVFLHIQIGLITINQYNGWVIIEEWNNIHLFCQGWTYLLLLVVNEAVHSIAKSWLCQPPILVSNHSFRWIVVAPNRKNIKGRFVEHVGYWAPRQGILVQRQITLNLPRIKYWMGNGAVPTPKVQQFLHHWDLMPKPFYVESSRLPIQAPNQLNLKRRWLRKTRSKQKGKEKDQKDWSWTT